MSSQLNTNPVLILTVQDFGDDGVKREDAPHDGDGGAMRHGMALRGRGRGAPPQSFVCRTQQGLIRARGIPIGGQDGPGQPSAKTLGRTC